MVYASTSHNRTVYVRRLWAARLRKTAVGLTPFVRFSLRHSLGRGQCYALLYYLPKPSYTAGTLCAIAAKLVEKLI